MNNKNIRHIISKMTLPQKVGALLTLGFAGTVVRPHIYEYIEKYHCGGLRLTPHARIFGNYVNPKTGETVVDLKNDTSFKSGIKPPYCTASQYKAILDDLQALARKRPLGLPLHFSYDQEGSESANFCFGGVNLFAYPMGIRATGDARYAYEVAKAVGKQGKAVGFSWIHSPVLDVNSEPKNPEIGIRAYSDNAQVVAEYAEQTCKGFKDAGMIATGKHFPGRGHSAVDAHFELPVIAADKETMLKRELLPYIRLIEKDLLPSIMIAHSIFPALDDEHIATVSKKILTGLLREEMGYRGVIATDSMTMGAIATRYGVPNACAMSLEAGADLVLMKAENILVEETVQAITSFVENGRISMEELENKVYRVLKVKYEYGLFHSSDDNYTAPEVVINDPKIVALSKEVAKKSVLVAKDKNQALPLCKKEKILIIEQAEQEKFNDMNQHSGLLFEKCLRYNQNISYLEVGHTYDKEDLSRITEKVEQFDTIVVTNYFVRGKLSNTEHIQNLIAKSGKKVVLVTNTPYELTIPKEIGTVIVTFSTTIANIEAVAGVLFGEILPEGEWPLES